MNSMNRKSKCYHIWSDSYICFILTVKQSAALAACILRARTKKGRRQLFWGKKWLSDFLTSKWPGGSFAALAFAPDDLPQDLSDLDITWLPWHPGAATARSRSYRMNAHHLYRAVWNADAVLRWEFCLFVRLSVRLSVCQTRALWQNGRKICIDFYTVRKLIYPSFLRWRMVGGRRPLLL